MISLVPDSLKQYEIASFDMEDNTGGNISSQDERYVLSQYNTPQIWNSPTGIGSKYLNENDEYHYTTNEDLCRNGMPYTWCALVHHNNDLVNTNCVFGYMNFLCIAGDNDPANRTWFSARRINNNPVQWRLSVVASSGQNTTPNFPSPHVMFMSSDGETYTRGIVIDWITGRVLHNILIEEIKPILECRFGLLAFSETYAHSQSLMDNLVLYNKALTEEESIEHWRQLRLVRNSFTQKPLNSKTSLVNGNNTTIFSLTNSIETTDTIDVRGLLSSSIFIPEGVNSLNYYLSDSENGQYFQVYNGSSELQSIVVAETFFNIPEIAIKGGFLKIVANTSGDSYIINKNKI